MSSEISVMDLTWLENVLIAGCGCGLCSNFGYCPTYQGIKSYNLLEAGCNLRFLLALNIGLTRSSRLFSASSEEEDRSAKAFYIHVTVHRNRFPFNNQPDALIIQIILS